MSALLLFSQHLLEALCRVHSGLWMDEENLREGQQSAKHWWLTKHRSGVRKICIPTPALHSDVTLH